MGESFLRNNDEVFIPILQAMATFYFWVIIVCILCIISLIFLSVTLSGIVRFWLYVTSLEFVKIAKETAKETNTGINS